jgi:quercetin dioxygenase-like cupin family protein
VRKVILLLAGAALVAAIGVGVALATAPSGTRTVDYAATGSFPAAAHFNADGVKLQVKDPDAVVTQAITYGPGASSGWHSHVGVVVIVVKDGSVTRYLSDCVGQTFHAGDVFVETSDLGPMVLRNESTTTPAHVSATFVVPQPVPATLRIDQPNPGCAAG